MSDEHKDPTRKLSAEEEMAAIERSSAAYVKKHSDGKHTPLEGVEHADGTMPDLDLTYNSTGGDSEETQLGHHVNFFPSPEQPIPLEKVKSPGMTLPGYGTAPQQRPASPPPATPPPTPDDARVSGAGNPPPPPAGKGSKRTVTLKASGPGSPPPTPPDAEAKGYRAPGAGEPNIPPPPKSPRDVDRVPFQNASTGRNGPDQWFVEGGVDDLEELSDDDFEEERPSLAWRAFKYIVAGTGILLAAGAIYVAGSLTGSGLYRTLGRDAEDFYVEQATGIKASIFRNVEGYVDESGRWHELATSREKRINEELEPEIERLTDALEEEQTKLALAQESHRDALERAVENGRQQALAQMEGSDGGPTKVADNSEELQRLRSAIDTKISEYNSKNDAYAREKARADGLERRLEESQGSVSSKSGAYAKLERDNGGLRRDLETSRDEATDIDMRYQKATGVVKSLRTKLDRAEERYATLDGRYKAMKRRRGCEASGESTAVAAAEPEAPVTVAKAHTKRQTKRPASVTRRRRPVIYSDGEYSWIPRDASHDYGSEDRREGEIYSGATAKAVPRKSGGPEPGTIY